MDELFLTINEVDYPLATSLRVAYVVQGQHNHKPYTEIFQNVGNMTVEEQIDIIYASLKVANPELAMTMSSQKFLNWALDNMPFKKMQLLVGAILKRILDADDSADETATDEEQGN